MARGLQRVTKFDLHVREDPARNGLVSAGYQDLCDLP